MKQYRQYSSNASNKRDGEGQNTRGNRRSLRKWLIGATLLLITTAGFMYPMLYIVDRITKPSRYRLLRSDAEQGRLLTLWEKHENASDVQDKHGSHPLFPVMTKLFHGFTHDPLHDLNLPYVDIAFSSNDEKNIVLSGWFVPASVDASAQKSAAAAKDTTVILCHGAFTDRREMLRHCRYLAAAGYNTLLFDFRDHGLSVGPKRRGSALGIREHRDIISAIDFIREKEPELSRRIVVMGSSTGAVSALKAAVRDPRINAVIAENPFCSRRLQIKEALETALRQGRWGSESAEKNGAVYITRMLNALQVPDWYLECIAWLADKTISLQSKSSDKDGTFDIIDRIHEVDRPLFLLHGESDTMVDITHSKQLYERAQGQKEFWSVPGGKHSMLYWIAPEEYERKVLDFLSSMASASASASASAQQTKAE